MTEFLTEWNVAQHHIHAPALQGNTWTDTQSIPLQLSSQTGPGALVDPELNEHDALYTFYEPFYE